MAVAEWPDLSAGTADAIWRLNDMAPRKTWLIVNSRSGSNSEAALVALERSLAEYGMPAEKTIAFPAEELPNRTVLQDADVDRLIVFTGDGTLNAVIEAVTGWSGEVLVLPGGTMNLLSARLHGADTEYDAILERIASGAFRPVRPKMACCLREGPMPVSWSGPEPPGPRYAKRCATSMLPALLRAPARHWPKRRAGRAYGWSNRRSARTMAIR
ncbi:diacylglycerol/lipid kinase family protein [Qipengyuania sp. Mu-71]|jgi:hypothetical protein|uniref:diacylglycerol/lipid kinase family protein n=1 Tax=Qipengyuania sp. Mu-71 TaxID=3121477 RepID=UPI002FE4DD77